MKRENFSIIVILACVILLTTGFSGCIGSEKKEETKEETTPEEGETTERYSCLVDVCGYNIGDKEMYVWFYMNDEYKMFFVIEPNEYANGAAERFYAPCNVEVSIYVADADPDSLPPWTDDSQGDWYTGYILVSDEDISRGDAKIAKFFFDENNGGLAETAISFEIINKEKYQGYYVDLYIDDNFIDSEYLEANGVIYRLVPNIELGRRKVSIYANGDWGERYVNVTSEWWTEGTTNASYVYVEIDVSAGGVVVY